MIYTKEFHLFAICETFQLNHYFIISLFLFEMNITDLPEDVLQLMVAYMSVDNRQYLKRASKKINGEMRNRLGYLRLNHTFSTRYLEDSHFREEVMTRIANPKQQLSLCACSLRPTFVKDETVVNIIASVHGVELNKVWSYGNNGLYEIKEIIGKPILSYKILIKKTESVSETREKYACDCRSYNHPQYLSVHFQITS